MNQIFLCIVLEIILIIIFLFYMKPKKIIEISEFPRNSSGKIDRKS